MSSACSINSDLNILRGTFLQETLDNKFLAYLLNKLR